MPIEAYPEEVREYARQIYEESIRSGKPLSYSQVSEEVAKQFPDIFPEKGPSKSTIKNWVHGIRDKVLSEEEPVEEIKVKGEVKEPKKEKVEVDSDIPPEYAELPQKSPEEMVDVLLEHSSQVEEPVAEPEEVELEIETPEEKRPFYLNRWVWIAAGTIVIVVVAVWLWKRRQPKPETKVYSPEEGRPKEPEPMPNEIRL